MDTNHSLKLLGRKAYGSIPHLPESRLGPGDYSLAPERASLLTQSPRDGEDRVIVTEKLDGACLSIAKKDGALLPLIRAGYHVLESPHLHLQVFARWLAPRQERFQSLLAEGERVVGEWLLLAHSIRYRITDPDHLFVPFDIIQPRKVKPNGEARLLHQEFTSRLRETGIRPAHVIADGAPISPDMALGRLGPTGFHGAIDPPEGAVWRMERGGKVEFLGKFVRADKVDGDLLPALSGGEPVWNWPVGEF